MCWSLVVRWISVAVFLYTEGQTLILGTVLLATLSYWGWGKADEETDLTRQIREREREIVREVGERRRRSKGLGERKLWCLGCHCDGRYSACSQSDLQAARLAVGKTALPGSFIYTQTHIRTHNFSIYPYFQKFPWVSLSAIPMHREKQEKQRKVVEKKQKKNKEQC